jgi:hypothetical protein
VQVFHLQKEKQTKSFVVEEGQNANLFYFILVVGTFN